MHRNHNLSFTAGADIHSGRALKVSTAGTVIEITNKNDHVIGWATDNVKAGCMASVRMMFEGTITVELNNNGDDYSAGRALTLSDDGTMKAWIPARNTESAVMGYLLENRRDVATAGVYADALILRHLNKWDQ